MQYHSLISKVRIKLKLLETLALAPGKWIKEAEKDDGLAFRGNGKLAPQ